MKFCLYFLLCYASVLTVLVADPFNHPSRGVDGKGHNANFNLLGGIAVDSHGNFFVSDTWDETIRKITPDGVVTTFAGKAGVPGNADGEGSKARFSSPEGLAIDLNDNIFVADLENHEIRKISSQGVVTTFAGMTKPQYRIVDEFHGRRAAVTEDGDITTATFDQPAQLAFDKAGNLYVTDGQIREISAAGTVSTLGKVGRVSGMAVDAKGTLYVSDDDTDNGTIFTLSSKGVPAVMAKYAGGGSDVLFRPSDVGIAPKGDIFAFGHGSLLKVSASGTATIFAGSFKFGYPHLKEGLGKEATLFESGKLAFDHAGNIYVANQYLVAKVSAAGAVTFLAGSPSRIFSEDGKGKEAYFEEPVGIAVDKAGMIYVADSGNEIIRKITPEGVVSTFAGTPDEDGLVDGPGNQAKFSDPLGLTFDREGNLLVADSRNDAIRKITPDGVVTTLMKDVVGRGPYHFVDAYYGPRGLAVGPAGLLYVTASNAVLRFDHAGKRSTFAGVLDNDAHGITDGAGTAARFNDPVSLVFDRAGNLYVADTNGSTIRKISPQGEVVTYAGKASQYGSENGKRSEALFCHPRGLAIGPDGALYVADSNNNVIRKISSNGIVSTFAGTFAQTSNSTDGRGARAELCMPIDLAFDQHGNLYVTENCGNAIRKIAPDRTVTTVAGGPRRD